VGVYAGLRQAVLLLVIALAVAAAVAGVWVGLRGGAFRSAVAVTMMVCGALIGLTSGTDATRFGVMDLRAFLGAGPERGRTPTAGALTPEGLFVFVCLPLIAAGGILLGAD
jgi:hypothetical protein